MTIPVHVQVRQQAGDANVEPIEGLGRPSPAKLGARITLEEVAATVHLSPERFRHLFVAATGTTFRAYVLWSRLNTAVAAGMGGQSWTQAAHLAGFAGSAHLNRTFKRMFGIVSATISRR